MDEFKVLTFLTLVEECKTLEALQNNLLKSIVISPHCIDTSHTDTYKKARKAVCNQASKLGVRHTDRWYSSASRYILLEEYKQLIKE